MNYADVAKGVIASPFVHNAYVEVLYDFGLLGFGWLLGLLSMMVVAVRRFLSAPSQSAQKPLYLLAICLAIYFLGCVILTKCFTRCLSCSGIS